MTNPNLWSDVEQTFAAARAEIRKAQDIILAEHRRQMEIDAIAAPSVAPSPEIQRILDGRVGSAR